MMIFELRKILASLMIWAFATLIILFNILMMSTQLHLREEKQVLLDIISEVGSQINEASLYQLEQMVQTAHEEADPFVDSETSSPFVRATLLENYLMRATEATNFMQEIDMELQGEGMVAHLGATGQLAETIRRQHQIMGNRVEELLENGSYRYFFFDGFRYASHSFLFNGVLRPAAMGASLLTALLTAFIVAYEFDNRTQATLYATKIGRNLQGVKLGAAMLATSLFYVLIMGITLGVFFLIYDYSGLWQVPINSIFVSEIHFQGIFFWDLTFGTYLAVVLAVLWLIQILFVLLAFSLSGLTRNSFLMVVGFFIFWGLHFLISTLPPTSSNLLLAGNFSPLLMILNLRHMFNIANLFPHFEAITLGGWGITLTGFCLLTIKRFKRINL